MPTGTKTEGPFVEEWRRLRLQRAIPALARHDYLYKLALESLRERLDFVTQRFENILFLGHEFAARSMFHACDIESVAFLPARAQPQSYDLIISFFQLHQANDVPGLLRQYHAMLRKNGLFMACCFGENTLHELREALMQAEVLTRGGAAQRTLPMIGLRDAAALLQHTGFDGPVADGETVQASYPHLFSLLHDLRGMAETNLTSGARQPLSRRALAEACKGYAEKYSNKNNQLQATFDVLFWHGWRA